MLDLIYLSIILIAISFAFIAIYLCFVLKRMTNTLKSLGTTMSEVEKQVQYITPELSETFRQTDVTVEDAREKLQATDSLFERLHDLGMSLQSVNTVIQNRFGKRLTDEEMDEKLKPYIEGIRWSEVGVQLYKKYQSTKPKNKNELMVQGKGEIIKVNGKEG